METLGRSLQGIKQGNSKADGARYTRIKYIAGEVWYPMGVILPRQCRYPSPYPGRMAGPPLKNLSNTLLLVTIQETSKAIKTSRLASATGVDII